MSDTFRSRARAELINTATGVPTNEQVRIGCEQLKADALGSIAKSFASIAESLELITADRRALRDAKREQKNNEAWIDNIMENNRRLRKKNAELRKKLKANAANGDKQ